MSSRREIGEFEPTAAATSSTLSPKGTQRQHLALCALFPVGACRAMARGGVPDGWGGLWKATGNHSPDVKQDFPLDYLCHCVKSTDKGFGSRDFRIR